MMTGRQFRAIRKRLGLTASQWGRALGYVGTDASVSVSVYRLEGRKDAVPPQVELLARFRKRYGIKAP